MFKALKKFQTFLNIINPWVGFSIGSKNVHVFACCSQEILHPLKIYCHRDYVHRESTDDLKFALNLWFKFLQSADK